jgi:hypothetical protein
MAVSAAQRELQRRITGAARGATITSTTKLGPPVPFASWEEVASRDRSFSNFVVAKSFEPWHEPF